jgi:hypothetical protein
MQKLHPDVTIGSYPSGSDAREVELVLRSQQQRDLEDAIARLEAVLVERSIPRLP